ncbi:hypothetical protein EW026_g8017, partial [Hermanssonia centrifuga]
MQNQVWQRDAPKRKRAQSIGDADKETEEQPPTKHSTKSKKQRGEVGSDKQKQTTSGTKTKQLPSSRPGRPVLQRRLLTDEHDGDETSAKDTPLPSKVIITAEKRLGGSHPMQDIKPADPLAQSASSSKSDIPRTIGKAKRVPNDDVNPSEDRDSDGGSGDEDSGGSNTDNTSGNNEDLDVMEHDPIRLQKALQQEVPRWADAQHPGDTLSDGEDEENWQPRRHVSRRSSQASAHSSAPPPETSGASSEDEEALAVEDSDSEGLFFSNDNNVHYVNRDKQPKQKTVTTSKRSKATIVPTTKKSAKRTSAEHVAQLPKQKAVSRREQAVQKERPRFRTASAKEDEEGCEDPVQVASRATTVRQGPRTQENMTKWEKNWPVSTRIIYNTRVKLNMSAQSLNIQRILKRVIEEFIVDYAFTQAIYPVDTRITTQRSIVIAVAAQLDFKEVIGRLQDDWEYAKEFIEVGEHRLTILRGGIKKTVNQVLAAIYELKQGRCRERVALLCTDLQYIYPGDVETKLDKKNPFANKLITQLLAAHFFNGAKSIASQYPDHFESIIEDKPDEKEIPEAMLGIVCVAIHDGLNDWTMGTFTIPNDFEVGKAEAEYLKVIDFLAEIKA